MTCRLVPRILQKRRKLYDIIPTYLNFPVRTAAGISVLYMLQEMVPDHLSLNADHNAKTPTTIPHLQYLDHLDLSMNNFGGMGIPRFIGSLRQLRCLNLTEASFGGTIPPNTASLDQRTLLDQREWPGMAVRPFFSLKYFDLGGMDIDLSKAAAYRRLLSYLNNSRVTMEMK